MKSPYLEICRLLAAAGYSLRDVAEFIEVVANQGPDLVMRDIDGIRKSMNQVMSNIDFDEPKEYSLISSSDTAQKIERLLIRDAGMPKMVAVDVLSHELKARYPGMQIPAEGRKGFTSWIRRLTSFIPEKELLHLATNIRNRSVHDMPSDWRLK